MAQTDKRTADERGLSESLEKGECVLVAGAGLSALAGLPSRAEMLRSLLSAATEHIPEVDIRSYEDAVERGDLELVANNVALSMPSDLIAKVLRDQFAHDVTSSGLHQILGQLAFSEILTTNYDTLLESVFRTAAESGVLSPADAESLLDSKAQKRSFILKLFGSVDETAPMIVSQLQYSDMLASNLSFRSFLEGLWFSRTFLFVGLSPDEIQGLVSQFSSRSQRTHFALCSSEDLGQRTRLLLLEKRLGVTTLPAALGSVEAESFLRDIAKLDRERSAVSESQPIAPTSSVRRGITRVKLEDIGPFEELEFNFPAESRWKVLLGDNGVGKSTILKSLAVAFGGADTRKYAGRLVRAGKSLGRITVYTETNPSGYLTEIRRKDMVGEAEVKCIPARMLEAEEMLALGFSPLRITSWNTSSGPQEMLQKGRPTVDDLLPLLSGEPDPRLDTVKQWIVNLDAPDKPRQIAQLSGHTKKVTALAFTADGTQLISGSIDGTVRQWNPRTGVEERFLRAHQDGVNAIALSAQNELLTASYDHTVKLWTLNDFQFKSEFKKANSQALAVAVAKAPDGLETIAAGFESGSLRVWRQTLSDVPVANRRLSGDSIWSDAIGKAGEIYAGYQSGRISSWSAESDHETVIRDDGSPIYSLALDGTGRILAVATQNGGVGYFDLPTAGKIIDLRFSGSRALAVAASSDGKLVAAGCRDGSLTVWEVGSKREIMNLAKAHRSGIWSLAFSPDGRSIATGSTDNTIRHWTIPGRESISDSRKTIEALFELIADITGRDDIEFLRVTESFQVLVQTGDATDGIPLEILSQGLISLLSWVGVLCQRFKEVSPEGTSALPHDGPAVVLIDELDAHMHPRWQQILIDRLRHLFPRTQFVACTHSPLIVAGLDKAEVERFRLSNGRVEMTDFDADMTMGRTDPGW